MQKKQAKVFAGLLSMSLAVSLMTPLQGVSGQAARRKIALSKKSVTMTVGQKKTIRIKNAKGKRIKWSIKKKSIASYKRAVPANITAMNIHEPRSLLFFFGGFG